MSFVWSFEIENSDNVFSCFHVFNLNSSTIARAHLWDSLHLIHVWIIHEETISLRSISVLASLWEESLIPLNAINNNILLLRVIEFHPWRNLISTSECSYITFHCGNVPVVSVMGIESLCEVRSPLIKWYPEFTLISISKSSLLLPLLCPEGAAGRPWSGIFGESPWVSHLNEFVDALPVCGEAETLKDTIGVTANKVVSAALASSGHWVWSLGTFANNSPKFSIGHLLGVMCRDRHTSEDSESFTWSTTTNLSVVDVQFRHGLLKDN